MKLIDMCNNVGYSINKPTRCTFCMFILQSFCNSTCLERLFRSSSGVHDLLYLQLCRNHAKHGLYRAADTVNHELLMMNEMVVRNMYSCTKIVE